MIRNGRSLWTLNISYWIPQVIRNKAPAPPSTVVGVYCPKGVRGPHLCYFRLLRPSVLPRSAKAQQGEHHQHQPAVFCQAVGAGEGRQGPARRASSASAGCLLSGRRCWRGSPRPTKASIISISRLFGAGEGRQGPARRASSASAGCLLSGRRCWRGSPRPTKASIISISRLSFVRPSVLARVAKAQQGEHHQHQPAVFCQAVGAGEGRQGPPRRASSASAGCLLSGRRCWRGSPRPSKASINQPAVFCQAVGADEGRQGPARRASSASAGCLLSGRRCWRGSPRPSKASIISISRLSFVRPSVLARVAKAHQGEHHQHQPAVFCQAVGAGEGRQGPARRASSASAGCLLSGRRCWRGSPRPSKASIISISRLSFVSPSVLARVAKAHQGEHHQHQPAVFCQAVGAGEGRQGPPRRASSASAGCLFSMRLRVANTHQGEHHQHQPAVFFQASQAVSATKGRQHPPRRASSASAGCLFSSFSGRQCY